MTTTFKQNRVAPVLVGSSLSQIHANTNDE
jgi:hypothetical protein